MFESELYTPRQSSNPFQLIAGVNESVCQEKKRLVISILIKAGPGSESVNSVPVHMPP